MFYFRIIYFLFKNFLFTFLCFLVRYGILHRRAFESVGKCRPQRSANLRERAVFTCSAHVSHMFPTCFPYVSHVPNGFCFSACSQSDRYEASFPLKSELKCLCMKLSFFDWRSDFYAFRTGFTPKGGTSSVNFRRHL